MALTQETLDRLWDFSDPAASLARFDDEMRGSPDPEALAELRTQRARALGLLERYDEAHQALDAVPDTSRVVAARVALERGRLRNSAGDPAGAVALFRLAESLADEADDVFLQVDALHMLAIADPAGGQEWTEQALRVLEGTRDARTLRWQVALHSNAGWALLDDGSAAEALTRFELAREAAVRWGTAEQVALADEAISECRGALEV
ncbi:MAG: hypothetical protein AAGC63_02900 [Propionicimonas sp.]|nr:hypothetical protein [Propionicimonas sp.]